MSFDFGVDQEFIEKEVQANEEAQKRSGLPDSGIYKVVIEKAYLDKSEGGATAINLEMQVADDEDRKLFWKGWIKSGDEKGNKATYTDQKTGEERLLPDWFQFNHMLKIAGKTVKELTPKDATLEKFGKQVNVKAIKELEGTKALAVVQQYEDDYSGGIKYNILDFLNVDGSAVGTGRNEEEWQKFLERNPIKKTKKKKEETAESKDEAKSAVEGW